VGECSSPVGADGGVVLGAEEERSHGWGGWA
jgi:hypothetical protein